MSAFFRAASGCIGPLLFGCSRSRGLRRADAVRICRARRLLRFRPRASGIPRDFDRERLPQRPHGVSLRRVFPRRRPGSRAAILCMASASGALSPVSGRPADFGLLGRGGRTPHFPAASPPEYGTFRDKQKMAANKKINNFSSKAPLFQLSPRREARPCDVSRETLPHLCFT